MIANNIVNEIDQIPEYKVFGRVTAIVGLMVEVGGTQGVLSIGDHCRIIGHGDRKVTCEVVGFRGGRALLMPFGSLDGIGLGCPTEVGASHTSIYPSPGWLGRVINALGEPVDGKGPLPTGPKAYRIHGRPPSAHSRQRVGGKIDVGVRSMNTFLTCCKGQRLGIFAGSGVGKSTLLSMMARHTEAEVSVIGLVGERGREAREFIEDDLGPEGLARSVVVIATGDEPPLVRRQAAYMTLTVSEYFRDQGKDVLCLMDSITRFAMAQREISLSAGEPPASKGYTPSVFAELPRLLERAGPGEEGQGSITGLFTVLVEGDDHNEPISDAVRGILDGHVVMERSIAERGRYPPINVLKSISRTMPACNTDDQNAIINRAKMLITTYENMAELIRLGAYRKGSDPQVDQAIHYYPAIEAFLSQSKTEKTDIDSCYSQLADIIGMNSEEAAVEAPVGSDGDQSAGLLPKEIPIGAAATPGAETAPGAAPAAPGADNLPATDALPPFGSVSFTGNLPPPLPPEEGSADNAGSKAAKSEAD